MTRARTFPEGFLREGALDSISAPLDLPGVNYYSPMRVAADPAHQPDERAGRQRIAVLDQHLAAVHVALPAAKDSAHWFAEVVRRNGMT